MALVGGPGADIGSLLFGDGPVLEVVDEWQLLFAGDRASAFEELFEFHIGVFCRAVGVGCFSPAGFGHQDDFDLLAAE